MIREIAFIVYPVADLPRARRFYESILRLRTASPAGADWVEYEIGGSTLAITSMDADHQPGRCGPVVALEVDDLESALRHVCEAGTPLLRPAAASPVCRFAVIADSDGNQLILHQRDRR